MWKMTKLAPIWSNLPAHVRKSVVAELDYKDRCSFRNCSQTDRRCADACPVSLKEVAIQIFEAYALFSWSDDGNTVYNVKYMNDSKENQTIVEMTASPKVYVPGRNEKIIWRTARRTVKNVDGENYMDMALRDFLLTATTRLSVHKITINDVIVRDYHPEANPEDVHVFRAKLLDALALLGRLIDAACVKLVWHSNQNEVLRILSHFNPYTLKSVWFADRKAAWDMKRIAETEHWAGVEEIQLELFNDLHVDDLLHANHIQAHVRDLSPEDVWRVIQAFIQKRTAGGSFHFSYQDGSPDLQSILNQFNLIPQNIPIQPQTQLRTVLSRRFLFTQRFPMPARGLVLVVMIAEQEVLGTVCNVDSVNVEAKIERGLLR